MPVVKRKRIIYTRLQPGTRVRIVAGWFTGHEGIVVQSVGKLSVWQEVLVKVNIAVHPNFIFTCRRRQLRRFKPLGPPPSTS